MVHGCARPRWKRTALVESWCQAAALLVCHTDPSPDATTGKATLFGAVTNLAFAGRPQPGDVLIHQVRAVAVRADAAIVEGETLVDGRPVMAVEQIVIALRPAAELVKA